MVIKYFIFVNYRNHFCPQAICVPIKDIDLDLLKKIDEISSLGNIISNVIKFEKNVGISSGYEINGILNNSKNVKELFEFWLGLVNFFDSPHIYEEDYSNEDSSNNELNNLYYKDNKFAYGIDNPIYKNIEYFYLSAKKYPTDIYTIIDTIKSIFTEEISIYNYVILKEKQVFI